MQPVMAIERIIDILVEKAAAYVIIIFGSHAKGLVHEESDIDIAYLGDKELDCYENFMLAQKLAAIAGRDVDLLNLRGSSTVMKAQIVAGGEVIYCSDEKRKADFFVKVLKEYALLNEERTVILREIERRGSVYGA